MREFFDMRRCDRLIYHWGVILFLFIAIHLFFCMPVVFGGYFNNLPENHQYAQRSSTDHEAPGGPVGGTIRKQLDTSPDFMLPENHQYVQRSSATHEMSREQFTVLVGGTIEKPPGHAPDFRSDISKVTKQSKGIKKSFLIDGLSKWFGVLKPNQGGIVWIAVIVTIIIAFNFKNLLSWQNMDVLLILLLSFLLIDIIHLGGSGINTDSNQFSLLGVIFLGIFLVSIGIFLRALIGVFDQRERIWAPNLSKEILVSMSVILFACNILLVLLRRPDDCGIFTNIGASRMLETGKFPYGDPTLRGGAAATYGPILYFAHIPFQLILSPFMSQNAPLLATKLTLLLFHLLGIWGLLKIGKRLGGPAIGWGLVCLYIGSAYVQGLGGKEYSITGMQFISHIAPAAITILAFAMLDRPFWSGTLLAVASGVLFYPAFFFPLWFGYYFWQRKEWGKFTIGFTSVCVIILFAVILMTQHSEGESVFNAIYESTIGHQESKEAYGSSTFSFWGTHPRMAAFWQEPLIKNWYLLKPSFFIFSILIGSSFFMVRGRTEPQFAFLIVAVVIAIQLWKSHAGGTYVEWYLPFLLIGLFATKGSDRVDTTDKNLINC